MDIKTMFPKLNNNNYHTWKFNEEMLLLERELWDVITSDIPEQPDDKWLVRDGKARAVIGFSLEEHQKVQIKKLKFYKEYWEVLKKNHEKANLTNRVSLCLRKLTSKKLQDGESMEDHIADFLDIADRLQDMDEEFPEYYNALEVRPETDLTLDMVKEKLIQESKRNSKLENCKKYLEEN
ncbi:hypothetical protein CVS40_3317 [Lucilia cuprina]|nr:hypothetical protein CVS40_3317 [Lucilia cuprina]